jgi:hypothetical protein
MKKWIVAVVIGVLAPFPINLLAQYLAQMQASTGNIWYGYALNALMFLTYFFLGVYLAGLGRLRTTGTVRRVRWAELALGVVLLIISLVMKLEQATGLVVANIDFIKNNVVLTQIVQFNDGLYLWVVLAGFFMTDAFQKVPVQNTASQVENAAVQAESARVKRVKKKKAKAKGQSAKTQPAAAETAQIKPPEAQPSASEAAQVKPEETQPNA